MKRDHQNSNVFVAQMSKLFGDLSHKTAEPKPQAAPRMTCTRLRRFRETKQDLLQEAEVIPANRLTETTEITETTETIDGEAECDSKESFADWVSRNQQFHKQIADRQYQESKANQRKNHTYVGDNEADKTIQGFANFSIEALLEVASNPETPELTQKWLAAHYDEKVREALAYNKALIGDVLRILVRDGEASVKLAVLENKNIREEDLLRLCGDNDKSIADKAKKILTLRHKPELNHRRAMAETANIDLSKAKSIRRRRR